MIPVIFPFRQEESKIFGEVWRPVAKVFFWSSRFEKWQGVWMIVDTGADYTLLPNYMARELGVNLEKDCQRHKTVGIGGSEVVYLFRKQKVKLGNWEGLIPVGFLNHDNIPLLLGRQDFMEDFKVVFENHKPLGTRLD